MPPIKLLVVDDDVDFLDELQESLQAEGYEVAVCSDGDSALQAALKLKPDLALLDLKMRGESGFQIAERLRKAAETKNIPIIAMTGFYTRVEHETLMKICGIDVCLIKPFQENVLKQKIASVLKQAKEGHWF